MPTCERCGKVLGSEGYHECNCPPRTLEEGEAAKPSESETGAKAKKTPTR